MSDRDEALAAFRRAETVGDMESLFTALWDRAETYRLRLAKAERGQSMERDARIAWETRARRLEARPYCPFCDRQ